MASAGLLMLIDDIASLLDDVALFTKLATKKTAGVLGDDLALNAQQVSGVTADRELPVVWAVAKGSAKNKLILVPAALLISAVVPWLITPLLMIGGAYLCFEGIEKLYHYFSHDKKKTHKNNIETLTEQPIDLVNFEKNKIKGAIRTDFVLSTEIVVIALGTVQEASFLQQVLTVSIVAALITMVVYGIVAAIVKLDDLGLYLLQTKSVKIIGKIKRSIGSALLSFCPYLMKSLTVVGTVAMFLVGGGILVHGLPGTHDLLHNLLAKVEALPIIGNSLTPVVSPLFNALVGVIAGAILLSIFSLGSRIFKKAPVE